MGSEQLQYHPDSRPEPVNRYSTHQLNKIATGQRVLMVAIVIYFALVFSVILRGSFPPIFGLVIFAVAAVANIAVLVMAAKIYGGAVALLLFVLSFIPLVGLIILLTINSKATKLLKQSGYKVGLLGAKAK